MNKAEFAIHLKTKRVSAGLSQTKLAKQINSCTQSIAKYEQGKSMPRNLANFLRKLEEAIRYDEDEPLTLNRTGSRKYSETITVGEDLEWQWYLEDVLEAQEMYNRGIPVEMIASSFGRGILETSIMLAIRAEEGHLEPRTSGVFGRLEG